MKTPPRISALLALLFVITALPSVWAGLCLKCSQLSYIANVGACKQCGEFTSSGAFALCAKCSDKENKCQHCQEPVAAPGKGDPAKQPAPVVGHKAPNGKPFPAHWGEPPRLQTKDLRLLPGGYGSGSGTLANWIQQNLDKDAAKEKPAPIVHKAPNGKPFPAHWGEPPRIQTRDLRPLPGGYGSGSGTLANWIQQNLDKDAKDPSRGKAPPQPVPSPAPNPAPTAELKNDKPDDAAKVTAALVAWAKAKVSCGGNYSYTVGFASAFGFGHTTTIVVENSKVVERRYEEFDRNPPPPGLGAVPNGYVEKGAQVGKAAKGAPAKTLDELYLEAQKIAGQALQPFERRYIITDKKDLLTSCFIVDTRIAGDAPHRGIALTNITLAAAKPAPVAHKAPNGKAFPAHWGAPPRIQTRDLRPLPGGYGEGSGTLATWIQQNLDKDAAKAKDTPDKPAPAPQAAVAAKVHSGHFVSNQYKPQDALTLAVFSTSAEFKAAFGTAAFGLGAGGKRLDYVGDAAFADGVVAALIRRGNTLYSYQLASTAKTDEGVLTLNILSAGKPDAAATFASPLIVSLPRAGVTHVRFVENDKVLGEVPLAAAVKEPAPATPAIVLDKTPGNKGGGKAKRKPFPAHWGAPPRIQTADYGPLPGGYGNGSSTMRGWIQKNLDLDAKDPNRGKPGVKPEDKQAEIERIQKRIVAIKALMQVARFTKEGYDKIQAELAELTARLKQLQAEDPAAPVKPQAARPPVSDAFAQLHPAGSYAPSDLLIGMKEGLSKADGEKALATALPGLTVVKGMFNNTILHVQLPAALNVEQAMAKLKGVPEVSYSELNQIVSITPVPRVLPRPQLQRQ